MKIIASIFVFRQSSRQPGFRDPYLEKITKIAARAAIALQDDRDDIASAALVSSFNSKSRMIPSFAADIPTEMEMVAYKHFETAASKITNKRIRH